jgi:hypothetical protein
VTRKLRTIHHEVKLTVVTPDEVSSGVAHGCVVQALTMGRGWTNGWDVTTEPQPQPGVTAGDVYTAGLEIGRILRTVNGPAETINEISRQVLAVIRDLETRARGE